MEVITTPTYNPIITSINIKEAKRYAGLRSSRDFPADLLADACKQAHVLAAPKATWNIYPYSIEAAVINAASPLKLKGASIKKHLACSLYVAVLAVTVGCLLEAEEENCFAKGEYAKALLIDAAASALVEEAADQAVRMIAKEATLLGCQLTSRFSPGYGDFALSVQRAVLLLADAEKIGISATQAAMLLPRKSITALIGLTPYRTSAGQKCENKCKNCKQINCIARKEN